MTGNIDINKTIKFLYNHDYSTEKIASMYSIPIQEVEQRLEDMGALKSDNKFRHTQDGYTQLLVDGKWVFEHRHVWEKNYGPIPTGWAVYQLNNINSDNRLENLIALAKRDKKSLTDERAKKIVVLETKLGIIHSNLNDNNIGGISSRVSKYILSKKNNSKWWTPLEVEMYGNRSSQNAKYVYSVFQKNPTQTIESIYRTTSALVSRNDVKNGLAELIAEKVVDVSNDSYVLQEGEADIKYVEGLREK